MTTAKRWQRYEALFDAMDILDRARLNAGDFIVLTHAREYIRTQAMDTRGWLDVSPVKPFVRSAGEGVDANMVRRF